MWKRLNQLCTEGAKEMIYLRHHLLMQAVFCFCFFLVNKILIALLTLWAVFCTATLAVFLHPQLWACSVSSCVLNVCTVLPVTWWSWGGLPLIQIYPSMCLTEWQRLFLSPHSRQFDFGNSLWKHRWSYWWCNFAMFPSKLLQHAKE